MKLKLLEKLIFSISYISTVFNWRQPNCAWNGAKSRTRWFVSKPPAAHAAAGGTRHGEAGVYSTQKHRHLWSRVLMATSKTVTSGAPLGKEKARACWWCCTSYGTSDCPTPLQSLLSLHKCIFKWAWKTLQWQPRRLHQISPKVHDILSPKPAFLLCRPPDFLLCGQGRAEPSPSLFPPPVLLRCQSGAQLSYCQ